MNVKKVFNKCKKCEKVYFDKIIEFYNETDRSEIIALIVFISFFILGCCGIRSCEKQTKVVKENTNIIKEELRVLGEQLEYCAEIKFIKNYNYENKK